MKKITFTQLKKMLHESTDADYELTQFSENFIETILDEGKIDGRTIKTLCDRNNGFSSDWESYYSDDYRKNMLTLNVKGRGAGDWSKYNRDGRAGDDIDAYGSLIDDARSDFYNEWNHESKSEFGISLYTAGRSNGHWGFVLDEMTDSFWKVFSVNDKAVAELYRRMKSENEYEEDASELGYDAALELNDGESVAKYIDFSPEFIRFLDKFETAVNRTSAEWETQEWNDEMFDNTIEVGESEDYEEVDVDEPYRDCGVTIHTVQGNREYGMKHYNDIRWFESKRDLVHWLHCGIAGTDGAEQDHYYSMLDQLEDGKTVVDYNYEW